MRTHYNVTSPWVKEQLSHYLKEMKAQKQSPETMRRNRNYAGLWLAWTEERQKDLYQITYSDVLAFIGQCHVEKFSPRHINSILRTLRHYFHTLEVKNNPAAGLILKGTYQRIPHNLLSKKELEELYEKYLVTDARTARNKVMAGLLIYQGVTTRELHKLEPGHVHLKEGKIYIPGGLKGQGRTLKLEAVQVVELQEYLSHTRGKISEEFKASRPGRKAEKINASVYDKLFTSMSGSANLKPALKHLILALRKINPGVEDAQQIRASVITQWLKEKDLRIVQYMAGHRCVQSTERYQRVNLEELQEALDQYHPLRSAD